MASGVDPNRLIKMAAGASRKKPSKYAPLPAKRIEDIPVNWEWIAAETGCLGMFGRSWQGEETE